MFIVNVFTQIYRTLKSCTSIKYISALCIHNTHSVFPTSLSFETVTVQTCFEPNIVDSTRLVDPVIQATTNIIAERRGVICVPTLQRLLHIITRLTFIPEPSYTGAVEGRNNIIASEHELIIVIIIILRHSNSVYKQ